jgi:hypothetical protein
MHGASPAIVVGLFRIFRRSQPIGNETLLQTALNLLAERKTFAE